MSLNKENVLAPKSVEHRDRCLLYAAPAWRGFATAQDCSRIDCFINRTV